MVQMYDTAHEGLKDDLWRVCHVVAIRHTGVDIHISGGFAVEVWVHFGMVISLRVYVVPCDLPCFQVDSAANSQDFTKRSCKHRAPHSSIFSVKESARDMLNWQITLESIQRLSNIGFLGTSL